MKKGLMIFMALVLLSSCSMLDTKTGKGAVIGTALGGLAGAAAGQAIGSDTESTLIGAAVGAALGGLAGTGVGYYMDKQEKALREALAKSEMASIKREGNIIALTLKGDVLFASDSTSIKPGLYNEIDRIATVMVNYPETRINIEGHTDSSGAEKYNMDLSKRRGDGVKNLLIQRGVADSRINVIPYGETQPKATNSTEAGRQLNRRVEIRIVPIT